MGEAWQILRDAGLPVAAPRTSTRRSPRELADALRAAIASVPVGRDRDALAAFVLAWSQHWPSSFATALGDAAAASIDWARCAASDPDRYLKLRRIALENLAQVL